ncbi:hypothetical protein Bca4012_089252 [Brassica carinata]
MNLRNVCASKRASKHSHLESDDLEDKSDEHLVELFLERSNRDFEVLGLVGKLRLKVVSEELEEDKAFVEKLLVNWDSGDGEDNVLVEKLLLKRDFEDGEGEGEVLVEKLLAKRVLKKTKSKRNAWFARWNHPS